MVEWDPIMGVIPPLSDAEWQATFTKYKSYPEYKLVHKEITLAEFKRIFYTEYAHRILGRTIGIVFLVPFLWFAFTRKLKGQLGVKLLVLFLLGGLQGLLGWYMVQSGLVDHPQVSPYRLTAHLMLALLILGYMLWIVFDLLSPGTHLAKNETPVAVRVFGWIVLFVVVVMIMTGGFVAGTKAGYAFNTWPKMYDRWVPEGLWILQPGWRNLFENIPTVQFVHRSMAILLAILALGFWFAARRSQISSLHVSSNILLLLLAIQIGLGISTLIFVMPIPVAVAHQGGALLVFSVALFIIYLLRHSTKPNV